MNLQRCTMYSVCCASIVHRKYLSGTNLSSDFPRANKKAPHKRGFFIWYQRPELNYHGNHLILLLFLKGKIEGSSKSSSIFKNSKNLVRTHKTAIEFYHFSGLLDRIFSLNSILLKSVEPSLKKEGLRSSHLLQKRIGLSHSDRNKIWREPEGSCVIQLP